jgi:hypothetical protein
LIEQKHKNLSFGSWILFDCCPFFKVGALCVTLTWLNLLSNIRKFPFLGIYVVMFADVLCTFLKLSVIIVLFIVAFSMGFYCLLAEQVS